MNELLKKYQTPCIPEDRSEQNNELPQQLSYELRGVENRCTTSIKYLNFHKNMALGAVGFIFGAIVTKNI